MSKKWFLIILILLTVINLTTIGTFMCRRYCYKKGFFPMGKDGHFRHMKRELCLTDEQVSRMKNSREKFDPKIEALSQPLKERRHALVEELMKESPDSVRVEYMLREIDSSQSLLQREVVNHLLVDKEIFTPEQREKFFNVILERFSAGNKPNIKRRREKP